MVSSEFGVLDSLGEGLDGRGDQHAEFLQSLQLLLLFQAFFVAVLARIFGRIALFEHLHLVNELTAFGLQGWHLRTC